MSEAKKLTDPADEGWFSSFFKSEKDDKKKVEKQPIVKPGFSWPSKGGWGIIIASIILSFLLTYVLSGLIGGFTDVYTDAGQFFLDFWAEKTWWMTGTKIIASIVPFVTALIVGLAVSYNWSALTASSESSRKQDEAKEPLVGHEPGKQPEANLKSNPVLSAGAPAAIPKGDSEPLTPEQQAATKSIWF